MTLLLGIATMVGGLALLVSAVRTRRVAPIAPGAYLASVAVDSPAGPENRRSAVLDAVRTRISPLLPTQYVAHLARRLEAAGQSRALTPEEVASAQVVFGAAGVCAAVMFTGVLRPTPSGAMFAFLLLPAAGVLAPRVWVERAAGERQATVRRDLPDVLDLLAISVEAGLGFEAALDMASRNFVGPLAEEVRRTLREMELGASRLEALTALKRRVDVPELSTFVTALTQADALGMPIGRVLHTQAGELRSRRRQWAREKAGKMPVKILFPLVGFIFPPIMVILLGPAGISVLNALQ